MELVDTHTHVACGDDPRFPLTPTGVASEWWRSGGSMDDLLGDLDANGVDRVVVVQAVGAYGYDCRCAASSVARHATRAALVVAVDMSDDPAAELAALLDAPPAGARIAGVRPFGVGSGDPAWLTDGRGARMWTVAAEAGITVVPCVLADRFDDVRALAAAHPDTPVAVDHCGFPDMCTTDPWSSIERLVELPNVHLKVSSYVLEAAEAADGDAAPTVNRLVAMAGADRLCWGSDHPQDLRHDYAGKLALARRAARDLDDDQRRHLFGATGSRLFFP